MASVRTAGTALEERLQIELYRLGVMFETNASDLPGKPDFVFRDSQVAVFVDGNFWHGYRFPQWQETLSPFWQRKISRTRERDQRNFRRLRRSGWKVLRFWQHQILRSPEACALKVIATIGH